ncbi:MAG TPA: S53 family peptidase [Gemmataceae bacterium]|nr:S53 family peptidase [Gemmataceae bacterium]
MTTRPPLRIRRWSKQTATPRVRLQLESLEDRTLLAGFAMPSARALPFSNRMQPFGSDGPVGYTPAQVRQAYGMDQILLPGDVLGDGTGTTIALVSAYDNPNIFNDLHEFNLQFGLPDPPAFIKVNQRGGTQLPRTDPQGAWAGETALDVEWAHALAPQANILLVETDDDSFTNLFAGVAYAAAQPGVVVVSMSFGSPEFPTEATFDSTFTTPTGHAGVTFVAASGDSGAPPNYPAISPYVVAVGGTTLRLGGPRTSLSESGWNGSGGGISQYEPQPAYQKGVVTQSTTRRTNPDVAYDADPNTGFAVYDSFNNGSLTPWSRIGGTSAAAPQWAALLAIANQGRALAGLGSLDGSNDTLPALYQLAAEDYRDITSGSSSNGQPVYSAQPGYDLVTGRGTPIAYKMVGDLVESGINFIITGTPADAPASLPPRAVALLHATNDEALADSWLTISPASKIAEQGLPENTVLSILHPQSSILAQWASICALRSTRLDLLPSFLDPLFSDLEHL